MGGLKIFMIFMIISIIVLSIQLYVIFELLETFKEGEKRWEKLKF